jgi:hypothetical protein
MEKMPGVAIIPGPTVPRSAPGKDWCGAEAQGLKDRLEIILEPIKHAEKIESYTVEPPGLVNQMVIPQRSLGVGEKGFKSFTALGHSGKDKIIRCHLAAFDSHRDLLIGREETRDWIAHESEGVVAISHRLVEGEILVLRDLVSRLSELDAERAARVLRHRQIDEAETLGNQTSGHEGNVTDIHHAKVGQARSGANGLDLLHQLVTRRSAPGETALRRPTG